MHFNLLVETNKADYIKKTNVLLILSVVYLIILFTLIVLIPSIFRCIIRCLFFFSGHGLCPCIALEVLERKSSVIFRA